MGEEKDKFTQSDWSAGTVNQTVNNYPDLSTLSLEEKVDLIARKIVGSSWYNEPGIMPTLKQMADVQTKAERERKFLFVSMVVLSLVQMFVLVDIYLF